jgi:hypothetical protein
VSSPKDDSVPHSDNNCASIDGFKSQALPQKIMNYSMLANASSERPKVIENEMPQSSSSEGGISCYLLQNQKPLKQFQSTNHRFNDWKFESPNRPD